MRKNEKKKSVLKFRKKVFSLLLFFDCFLGLALHFKDDL
jgi:hypothetical protein